MIMNELSILMRWDEYTKTCTYENDIHLDRCGGWAALKFANHPDKATRGAVRKDAPTPYPDKENAWLALKILA